MRKAPIIISLVFVWLPLSGNQQRTVSQTRSSMHANASNTKAQSHYWRLRNRITVSSLIGAAELLAFNPSTSEIAISGSKHVVIIGNSENGSFRIRLPKQRGVAFSPTGKILVTIGDDRKVYLWDCATGRMIAKLKKHGSFIHAVSFSPDGTMLATQAVGSKRVFIWETVTGNKLGTIPDGEEPIYPRPARSLLDWILRDVRIQPNSPFFAEDEFLVNVEISPDAKTLAITANLAVSIWDISSKQLLRKFGQHKSTIYVSAFSPDGRLIATGSRDWTAKLWEVVSGRLEMTLSGHQGPIVSLSFSPDGKTLATGSKDKTVRLWDVASGRLKAILAGHDGDPSVLFSPDGRQVVTATDRKVVKVWDANNGQLIAKLEGARYPIACSPNGRTLATAGEDGNVLLWEVSGR